MSCDFADCPATGERRIVATAGEAAQWSLRPELLAIVDRARDHDGADFAVGLRMCLAHAQAATRRPDEARSERERVVLDYLADHVATGGACADDVCARYGWTEGEVRKVLAQLERAGVVERTGHRRRTRQRRLQPVFRVRTLAVPAVQPILLPEEDER